jgi:tetratricopeptide (TPR) repeat protein
MSPEQAEGRLADMGPASDVYSLGATLFALLAGRPPLEDSDVAEVLRKVRRGEIPPAREVSPRVPAALEAVCRKAMAPAPRDRYPSARALADDVEHWLADEPVSAYREPWWERERRQLKRHRSLVAALAIAAPVAIVSLSTIVAHEVLTKAQLQKNNDELAKANDVASKSLAKARRREDLAFRALDNYRTVIQEIPELQQRPDLLPVRRRLLEAPLDFYRQLEQEVDAGDPSERDLDRLTSNRVALAQFNLAAIGAEIGDEADAMKAYGQAIDLMESLLREHDEPQYRHQLATALNNVANLHVSAGRLGEARAEMDRALALRERSARDDGGRIGSRSDLALSHQNLGWLDSKTGRPESALAHYRKARGLREALAREAPDQEWRRTTLAQTCSNLGWMLASLRRRDEARECFVRARDIQEALVTRQPTYVSYRVDLAATYNGLAGLEEGDAALAPMKRGVDLREALAREAPSVASYQSGLATALMMLGNIHRNARRFDEAAAAQRRAVAVLEPVVRGHSEAGQFGIDLANCLNHLGLTLVDAGRAAEALPAYERALDLLAPVRKRDSSNFEVRSLTAGALNNRGLALAKLRRHEEALDDYRKAIAEERVCFEAAPQLYQYRKWLNLHIYNMGKSLRALGRLDEAYATYRDRMKLWDEAPPEQRSPEENYDAACSLALLVPAVGQGKPDDALNEAERARRRRFTDEAFAELRAAVEGGFSRATLFAQDRDFDAIRSDPRFAPLLLRVMDRAFPADPFAPGP